MSAFRVALSSDFLRPDGVPQFRDFDLDPLLSEPGLEIEYVAFGAEIRPDMLAAFDAAILLLPRFSAASPPSNGRLGVLARFGVGYDMIDVDACTRAGIALTITPAGVRRPMAVAILTLVLALAGKLLQKDRLTRLGPAGYAQRGAFMGTGLIGRTLGSIGIGNIGADLFEIAKPLGMRFIAHDPFADPAKAASLGVELVDLATLFREADFVSVSCPLNDDTRGLVNAERLALMKPTAFLINTARGPIVDQAALVEALRAGRIAGAGLDVQEHEPPDPEDPLLTLDNVILAPHALGWTDQCFHGIGAAAIRSVLDFKAGRVPEGLVNREVLATAPWRERLERRAR